MSDFSHKEHSRKETNDLWTIEAILEAGEGTEFIKESMKSGKGTDRVQTDNDGKKDFNTPTLVAEKFTDLYHNEWVEAFEILSKGKLHERSIIQLLLEVVEEAYRFCQQEAARQVQDLHSAFLDILEFGTNMGNYRERPSKSSLIAKYRKDMAGSALKKLIQSWTYTWVDL
ncbi:uncharacterized protein LOC123557136 isoform X2 [Mercenaria mercenaria]|uniref:uncharacterized protein LOC123557136 isoform X2 n=1 Tax=Mercenaria mercenaria TaxID=6596 RepID=UPI00234FA776|nr:uncharacterized protein LOC123557136 isoform X2 [Mercenaria mercenaria]